MSNSYNIMLIGKTGHGKSATANCIIGREDDVFKSSGESTSVTSEVQIKTVVIDGTHVNVIDSPGLRDTELFQKDEEQSKIVQYVNSALDRCGGDIDLFLFVLPYGVRFTAEEIGAFEDLKAALNKEDVFNRCMVVFTRGDDFCISKEYKGEGDIDARFSKWCKNQKGPLKNLLELVDYRCCLFENIRWDADKKLKQTREVIEMAKRIRRIKGSYTKEQFKKQLIFWQRCAIL